MRFDLVDLRLALNVAEAHSITHGAARSGMTLASASERIRAMEKSLGVALFERKRRGVDLTPAGAALVEHARLVTQQLERMRGDLSRHATGMRSRVRLFSNTATTLEFLPKAVGAFLAAHPNIDIELEDRPSGEIVRAVTGGRADIGIVADAIDAAAELDTFPFARDQLVVVTPRRHPLARRRRIAFRETLAFDFVGLPVASALQDHIVDQAARLGHRLKLRVRLPGIDAVCRLVEAGIGVAVVSRIAALRCRRTMDIAIVPLSDPWALRHLRISVRSLGALSVQARSLVEHLGASGRARG
jgi:DNA-binding transcriptional LysR family regulator